MVETMDLQSRLTTLFVERLHLEVTTVETDLFETGALDSLQFVELLLHLEKEFGISISADDLDFHQFRSIAKIADFVASRQRTQHVGQTL